MPGPKEHMRHTGTPAPPCSKQTPVRWPTKGDGSIKHVNCAGRKSEGERAVIFHGLMNVEAPNTARTFLKVWKIRYKGYEVVFYRFNCFFNSLFILRFP